MAIWYGVILISLATITGWIVYLNYGLKGYRGGEDHIHFAALGFTLIVLIIWAIFDYFALRNSQPSFVETFIMALGIIVCVWYVIQRIIDIRKL